jgi:addiction module RelE/StbE family toxin
MTYRLLITERAVADLTEIRDYIAVRSPSNAVKFLEKLLSKFDLIEALPETFAKAPEDKSVPYTLRQFIVKPYRILYRVVDDRVEIIHIRHAARLPAKPDDLS